MGSEILPKFQFPLMYDLESARNLKILLYSPTACSIDPVLYCNSRNIFVSYVFYINLLEIYVMFLTSVVFRDETKHSEIVNCV